MFSKFLVRTRVLIVAVSFVLAPLHASAQDTALEYDATFTMEELDQILAPIALYPDDLLSFVLMASTYPLEIVQAARWVKEPTNAKLKGEDLTQALAKKDWEPSVKSLTPFPEVLEMMSEQLEWTQKLGDAVLEQEADVMDQIQHLRDTADEAGYLKSNEQQMVSHVTVLESSGAREVISIEPAEPDVVYVPVYEPAVAYGSWSYPDYPPYYWPPLSGGAFVSGFFWGAGVTVASSIWGWGNCNWANRNININVNRYNRINVNRRKVTSNKWTHNAYHRRGVKYRNNNVRQKYAKRDIRAGDKARLDYRGYRGKPVLRPNGDRRPGAPPKPGQRPEFGGDKRPGADRPKFGDRGPVDRRPGAGPRPGQRPKLGADKGPGERPKIGDWRPADRPGASKRPRPDKRPSAGPKRRSSTVAKNRARTRPAKRPSAGTKKRVHNYAFSKPTKRATARRHASRGRSSMARSRGFGRGGGGRRR